MLFRIYHMTRGIHTHMRIFAGPGTLSLSSAGEITLREDEFKFLKEGIERTIGTPLGIGHYVEFIERETLG